MTAPVSKTAQCIALFKKANHKGWLRIISTWRDSKGVSREELAVFVRGYGCLTNAKFYAQVGFNPIAEVEKAKTLFFEKFVKELK